MQNRNITPQRITGIWSCHLASFLRPSLTVLLIHQDKDSTQKAKDTFFGIRKLVVNGTKEAKQNG